MAEAMSTLYRPVRIETAEQAEALPIGTVAINGGLAACKSDRYSWDCNGGHEETPNARMVGWTALVPVEAHTQDHAPIPGWGERERRHRLVTAWLPGPPPGR